MGQKQTAKHKLELTIRSIEGLKPQEKTFRVFDTKLAGYGVKVFPLKAGASRPTISFFIKYRPGSGGRTAPVRETTLGRYGELTPTQARKKAEKLIGEIRSGGDPTEQARLERETPTLSGAYKDYLASRTLQPRTRQAYDFDFNRYLESLHNKRVSDITRRDISDAFNRITKDHGETPANRAISLVGSVIKPLTVDYKFQNPVDLWKLAGGKMNKKKRRKIQPPAEVLPCWAKGIREVVDNPVHHDAFMWAIYTGLRVNEVLTLRWNDVSEDRFSTEVKGGQKLELPLTSQLLRILQDRRDDWSERLALAQNDSREYKVRDLASMKQWVFPAAKSPHGRTTYLNHHYQPISDAGGARFYMHATRNCYLTVGQRDLLLPLALCKRLVGHEPPRDVTEEYASEWTYSELQQAAQTIADRIEELIEGGNG
ncbi:MAG: hypothetical protein CMO98_13580 [Woeseia sp.]|nr:hypothetical protein [Woeseia sp.]|tara:strand:- start:884 stop:2164 length:1281 start_codon:yes stop_codon:yes gene_type:complete